jgi:sigma-B regulation protein RsbU (phosphoserine phosphatase)
LRTRDQQIDELERRVLARTRELEDTHAQLEQTQAKLIQELERELQTAYQMQMALMPEQAPRIEGIQIAGRCIPASHVGGDFYQYYTTPETLTIAAADVTGHAMKAAIPMVMFSGFLENQMESPRELSDLFSSLNRSLYRSLDRRTFVCFVMVELSLSSRRLHFHASTGTVTELVSVNYPLEVRPESEFKVLETQLEPGDRVVLHGVPEPGPGTLRV